MWLSRDGQIPYLAAGQIKILIPPFPPAPYLAFLHFVFFLRPPWVMGQVLMSTVAWRVGGITLIYTESKGHGSANLKKNEMPKSQIRPVTPPPYLAFLHFVFFFAPSMGNGPGADEHRRLEGGRHHPHLYRE